MMAQLFQPSDSRTNGSSMKAGISKMKLGGMSKLHYYLAVPESGKVDEVVVLVHGISRNIQWLVESFWPLARNRRVALVAPLFAESTFRDFQRLGRNGRGPRADLAIQAILAEVRETTGWHKSRAFFFGHSAGAQFVQRYMFAHPQRVARAALSAAGCYTFPVDRSYPAGIGSATSLPGIHFEPARFLRVPTAVFVGQEDTTRDGSLNCSRKVDSLQGTNRLQRARNWVRAMATAGREQGLEPQVELFELPGISHDYAQAVKSGQLNQKALAWLLSD